MYTVYVRMMCTRFTIASGVAAIEREFQAEFQFGFVKQYNAHFGMELPVIASCDENKIVAFRWGLLPFWSKEPNLNFHHITAPVRGIVKNPAHRSAIRSRRCLVLANCFFIWTFNKGQGKIPYVVYDAQHRLMSFAGIWDVWENDEKTRQAHSFAIVTTHASRRLQPFSKTMPVIIPEGRRRKYLRKSSHLNEVMSMLRPSESDSLNLYPVSPAVNDFQKNSNEILMPVGQRVYKEFEYVPKVYLKLEGMGSMKDNPDRKPEFKLLM